MVPALFSNECGADECGAVQLITLVRMAIFAAGTALNAPKCTEMYRNVPKCRTWEASIQVFWVVSQKFRENCSTFK